MKSRHSYEAGRVTGAPGRMLSASLHSLEHFMHSARLAPERHGGHLTVGESGTPLASTRAVGIRRQEHSLSVPRRTFWVCASCYVALAGWCVFVCLSRRPYVSLTVYTVDTQSGEAQRSVNEGFPQAASVCRYTELQYRLPSVDSTVRATASPRYAHLPAKNYRYMYVCMIYKMINVVLPQLQLS